MEKDIFHLKGILWKEFVDFLCDEIIKLKEDFTHKIKKLNEENQKLKYLFENEKKEIDNLNVETEKNQKSKNNAQVFDSEKYIEKVIFYSKIFNNKILLR